MLRFRLILVVGIERGFDIVRVYSIHVFVLFLHALGGVSQNVSSASIIDRCGGDFCGRLLCYHKHTKDLTEKKKYI